MCPLFAAAISAGAKLEDYVSGHLGFFSFVAGAIFTTVLQYQFTYRQQRAWFRIQAFERFRRELSGSTNFNNTIKLIRELLDGNAGLRPPTEEDLFELAGFFEEVGLYNRRGLVDFELVDEIMGDEISETWDYCDETGFIQRSREEWPSENYWIHFEHLATKLRALTEEREAKHKRSLSKSGQSQVHL
jgi:hypothetical protein